MTDLCMCSLCRERAEAYCRVAAFGAIRRAAELARNLEQRPWSKGKVGWVFDPNDPSPQISREIRRAIRSAIGSPKA